MNRRPACVLATVAVGCGLFTGTAVATEGGPRTIAVRGSYVEHAVGGTGCQSPVGLCIAGEYRGTVRGTFEGAASAIVPTADSPTTTVSAFTSNSTITAMVHGLHGVLWIKNAGVFSSVDGGPIVDVQTIIGGTGDFVGASGFIRASGTFSFVNGGVSTYTGTINLPRHSVDAP